MNNPPFRYDDPFAYRLWKPELLARLLERHGIEVTPSELPHVWRRLVTSGGLPVTLADALFHVSELASMDAHDALITDFGGPLFAADRHAMPPADLSLLAYMEHPEVFNRIRGRRVIASTRRFQEFKGREALAIELPDDDTLQRLARRIGLSFERRNRSNHCRILPHVEGELFHFDIGHGGTPIRDGALDERGPQIQECSIGYRPHHVDRVSYDPRSGVLRVTARDAVTIRTYCQLFGEVLFGQIGWFSNKGVLTLAPLVVDATAALRPTRGIRDIQLVRARVAIPGRAGLRLTFDADDVFAGIAEYDRARLEDGELVEAQLLVRYDYGGMRKTTLGLPNRVTYNNHRDERVIRGFLEERGFLAGPMRFRMAS